MASKYSVTERVSNDVLDWMDPGTVTEGSWTEMAAEFAFGHKVVAQEQLDYRLDPRPTGQTWTTDAAWLQWPVEDVAALAVAVIRETIPPQRWAVPEADADAAVVQSLRSHGDDDDEWRNWYQPEVLADLVAAVVGCPFH